MELTRSYGGDHDAMCRAWPALVMLTADLGARERAGGAAPFVAWLNQELEQHGCRSSWSRTDDVPPAARKRAVRKAGMTGIGHMRGQFVEPRILPPHRPAADSDMAEAEPEKPLPDVPLHHPRRLRRHGRGRGMRAPLPGRA